MLVISSAVLQEYLDVLARFLTDDLLNEWAATLTDPARVIVVEPTERIDVIRTDPADNRFLECAIAASADRIVSGDRDLLVLKVFRGIPIVTPTAFLKQPG